MDEAAAIRDGAREVLRDVSPPALRRDANDAVADGWSAPGVLTVIAARRAGAEGLDPELRSRAIGVQLIYEGLALTRRLVREEPWTHGRAGSVVEDGDGSGDGTDPDVEVLVADVLVARGMNLLAYTEAADRCVEVIRNFGRRQTGRPVSPADRQLEADIVTLAAVAGTTAVAPAPATRAVEWAEAVASTLDAGDLPDAASLVAGAESLAGPTPPALANEGRGSRTDP